MFVIVGRGAAVLAQAAGLEPGARLVVVLPEGLPEAEREAEAAGLPGGACVVSGEGQLLAAMLGMGPPLARQLVIRPTRDPWADADEQGRVGRWVRRALHSWRIQAHTIAVSGPTWLEQSLNNLAAIAAHPSVAALRGAFAGKPCVIASPGPSLTKNVQLLRELKGKALVISGTHGLSILERAGAVPDVLLAADAGDLERHIVGCDLASLGAFVVGANCRRETFELPAPHVFTFSGNGPADAWIYEQLGEDASLASGGSVACSALSLAHAMGCDPIAFVGQDLAFSGDRFYAEGSLDGAAEVRRNPDGSFFLRLPGDHDGPGGALEDGGKRFTGDQRLLEVPGYHGGTVPTSESFYAFLIWFEGVAGVMRGKTRLWNCTEGGARIGGMEHLPLAHAVEAWRDQRVDAAPVLAAARAAVDLGRRRARPGAFAERSQRELDRCASLAARCGELSLTAHRDRAALEALSRGESELARSLRAVDFLALFAQDAIEEAQDEARRATDVAGNLAAARRLFTVVEQAGARLAAPLARARRELARRG